MRSKLLVSSPVLVDTDASIEGLGAVLEQEQEGGMLHPVAYDSRSLSKAERNYGIPEFEAFTGLCILELICMGTSG